MATHQTHVTEKLRHDEQDGPPLGPVPVFFKTVKPVSEPLSRYGNPVIYQVNGQTYEVMTTAHGYRARGLASWYGTKFHQKRTSSGEDYDLYALTAAHKTLPLPTYVKVKHLINEREVIVKVNDRGPFHEDRIIDLSYGAAAILGILQTGTAPVEIEAITINGTDGDVAHYYLQAGAFNSEQLAQGLREQLAELTSYPVFIETHQGYFIVKIGPISTQEMMDNLRGVLEKRGIRGTFSLLQ